MRRAAIAFAVLLALTSSRAALAQRGPPGGQGGPPPGQGAPIPGTQQPAVAPADPLLVTDEQKAQIGSDYEADKPPPAQGALKQRFYGVYEESRGDYRFRTLPPFYFEHTRGLFDPAHPDRKENVDRELLAGLLYYQRRSAKLDADVIFPLFWHVRSGDSYLTAIGPFLHREAPNETDNWLAPLYFGGTRKEGGYFHAPLLLTTSSWSNASAFTIVGPYFRVRNQLDVDAGLAPVYFHGEGGDEGARKNYTLIPPLLFYHRENELDKTNLTVAGPVIVANSPYRAVFDIAPFFFHIHGKPESGGVRETHTTFFPLFHYGKTETDTTVATPLFLYRGTETASTFISPLYSHFSTRNGATSTHLAGPVLPLFFHYQDHDVEQTTWGIAPFFFSNQSHTRSDFLTPLFGRFEKKGVSRTYWVFPTLTASFDAQGFETDFHPLVYVGRSGDARHTVVAPLYWDFSSPRGRQTVGFPLFWRFTDTSDDSVVQVVANTLYTQKKVAGGLDWQFHFLPLFSYGHSPTGHFWSILFGLTGYERNANGAYVKALWFPIRVGGPTAPAAQAIDAPTRFH